MAYELKISSYNVTGTRAQSKLIDGLFVKEKWDVLSLQETLLAVNNRLPTGFGHEAIRLQINATGWAPRGSAMLIKDDIRYTLVTKEIDSSYEPIAMRVGGITIV